MRNFGKMVAGFMILGACAAPAAAWAQVPGFLPFGGRVISSIPCLSPEGPGFWVTIAPFGIPGTIPFSFIWTPFTLSTTIPPLPSIPPTHPGEQILGTYVPLVPEVCTVGLVPFFGFRMLTQNNSLPSGGF